MFPDFVFWGHVCSVFVGLVLRDVDDVLWFVCVVVFFLVFFVWFSLPLFYLL